MSRGSGPWYPHTKPLVSYRINRQVSGWILPPLMIRAFGAHCQDRTSTAAQQIAALFDHPIGNCEELRWNCEPEHPGGLEIDDQVELGTLDDR